MSTEQLDALRLANAIDYPDVFFGIESAAELRRLHSVNSDLLEALKLCEGNIKSLLASAHPKVYGEWLTFVSAAIAQATGEQA